MVTFIVRRLIAAVFLLIIVSMVIFAIFFWLPKLGGQTTYGLATQYVGRTPPERPSCRWSTSSA